MVSTEEVWNMYLHKPSYPNSLIKLSNYAFIVIMPMLIVALIN